MSRTIKPKIPTYGQYYESLGRNAKTSKNFAIAEFIDNSIESYESANSKINGLNILIKIDIKNELIGEITETQHLTIKDNAAGIKIERLEEIISTFYNVDQNKPYIHNEIKKGDYNYGLKFASFYLGSGFNLTSKVENEDEYNVSIFVDNTNRDIPITEFPFSVNENIDEGHKLFANNQTGTNICIKNIKVEKHFTLDDIYKLIEFISYRYETAINRGGCIMIVCEHFKIQEIVKGNNFEFFSIHNIPIDGSTYKINEDLKKKIYTFIQNKNYFSEIKNEKELNIFDGDSKPWNLMFSNSGLVFEHEYVISNQHSILIKWGMLSHKYKKDPHRCGDLGTYTFSHINGILTSLGNRGINHPLKLLEDPESGCLPIAKTLRGSMPKFLMIENFNNAGSFISAEPNKKCIVWNDKREEIKFKKIEKFIFNTAQKLFEDSLQPIIDFIENGCIDATINNDVDLPRQNIDQKTSDVTPSQPKATNSIKNQYKIDLPTHPKNEGEEAHNIKEIIFNSLLNCNDLNKLNKIKEILNSNVKHLIPIEDCKFSRRSYNCLKKANIKYLEDLSTMTRSNFRRIQNLGHKSQNEILSKLYEFGLSFKEDVYEL